MLKSSRKNNKADKGNYYEKTSLKKYTDFLVKETETLLNIDSPGYTENAAAWVLDEFTKLGFEVKLTNKGGVLVSFGGSDKENGLLLEAHVDTLGGMVAEIKGNGRLRLTNLGGMNPNNAETENVRVVTKFNGVYEGTFQLCNASIHVNGEYNNIKRDWDTCEVVLDEDVKKKKIRKSSASLSATSYALSPMSGLQNPAT